MPSFSLYQKTSDMDLSIEEKKLKEIKELKEKLKELEEKLRQLMERRKVQRRKLAGFIRLITKPQQSCNEKYI